MGKNCYIALGSRFPGAELEAAMLTLTLWYSLAPDYQETFPSKLQHLHLNK